MSPAARYASQLNRIARVLETAHEQGDGFVADDVRGRLLDASRIVREVGSFAVQELAKRGSGNSPGNSQVDES